MECPILATPLRQSRNGPVHRPCRFGPRPLGSGDIPWPIPAVRTIGPTGVKRRHNGYTPRVTCGDATPGALAGGTLRETRGCDCPHSTTAIGDPMVRTIASISPRIRRSSTTFMGTTRLPIRIPFVISACVFISLICSSLCGVPAVVVDRVRSESYPFCEVIPRAGGRHTR